MRLIINATNLQRGGALQVASELLQEWRSAFPEEEYHVFLSPQLAAILPQADFPANFRFYAFDHNPGSSVWTALNFYRKLSRLEAQILPDLVFTVFGPALWRPRQQHLCGFANGYYLFDDAPFIQNQLKNDLFRRLYYRLRSRLLFRQLGREADALWVETESARQRLNKKWTSLKEITVIGNTYGRCLEPVASRDGGSCSNFLYLTAWYPHKNLEILPEVVQVLAGQGIRCRILLTLPPAIFDTLFKGKCPEGYIYNLGPVHAGRLRHAYEQADAALIPTLLETFSAAYPEAMRMEKPVLTSDLDFAKEVCGDAALYFNPADAVAIAARMIQLMQDRDLYEHLVRRGKERLSHMETPASRASRLMHLMQQTVQQKSSGICVE